MKGETSMDERLRILELIEAGEISVEEGVRRLEALAQPAESSEPPVAPEPTVARPAWVRWLWQPVLWTGVALTAGGGLLLTTVYTGEVAGGRLVWGWLMFALGVLTLLLGWWLQRAHWLYVRVREHEGPRLTLAFPLPLGLVAWGLRVARPFVPRLEETGVDELILAMRDEMRHGRPFVVDVDESEGGERVQVYFG